MSLYYINKNPYVDTKDIEDIACRELSAHGFKKAEEPFGADVAVSIGGDGTFIDTANMVSQYTDIIGVNMGTLGYLAEVEPDHVKEALRFYMESRPNIKIEKRMRIHASWLKQGNRKDINALNDIVIAKDQSSVINVSIFVNSKKVAQYNADGVIFSTPTGSTGYAFSCGAPVVDPESEVIIITPIAAHSLMNRSIVVPSDAMLRVEVNESRGCDTVKLLCDGKEQRISADSIIAIEKSECVTRLVKFNNESFCDRVVRKMK